MTDEVPFAELVARLRAGDQAAAAELVHRYEPVIRLEIRMGMRDSRLRKARSTNRTCASR